MRATRAKPAAGRRTITFASLDEVMPEVDRLLAGHVTVGKWTLAQICNHLAGAMAMTVDGAPMQAPWLIRKTIGPLILRRILKNGRFPTGIKLPEKLTPRPGLDARAEAESLRGAIQFLAGYSGPLAEHPLGGRPSREVWERLQCIHCAHHLSFAIPTGDC